MKTAILACSSLEKEISLAIERTGTKYPLYVLKENDHDIPHRLRRNIQQHLNTLNDYNRILMAFGTCGGAMVGLQTGDFELVIPRVDDCLSLLMGSMARRQQVLEGGFGIFLTESWLRHSKSMSAELARIQRIYTPERARQVIQAMYGKFDSLNVIDTGAYDVEAILPETRALAEHLDLIHRIQTGTTAYLEALITGPWPPEHFIRIQSHSTVTHEDTFIHSMAAL